MRLLLVGCRNGSYGYECNETCGHCRDQSDCHKENGSCFNGCGSGFIGDLCKTRRLGLQQPFK